MKQSRSPFASLDGVSNATADALDRLGFHRPFPVQSAVIPKAVRGGDLLVQAPTGSGKTLAFGVPIIEQMKIGTSRPTALVLVPTRELAVQVSEELQLVGSSKRLKVVPVFGGAPIDKQAMRVRTAAIVVATPGRLDDLLRNRRIDLTAVRTLVLDEADRMLDMGFQPQVDAILKQMPPQGQTMLFSATLEGPVSKLARTYTSNADVIHTERQSHNDVKVEHELMATTTTNKVDTMMDVLDCERDLTVVFVRTQRAADRITQYLNERGVRSTAIHGGMTQAHRTREYKRFRDGNCEALVATDVFARGMDVDRITHVLNYDIPEDADTYRHRAGRTGRAGRVGKAVTMVLPSQKKQMRRMLVEAGQPESLIETMRQPSGKKYKPVAMAERPADRGNDKPAAKRSKGEGNGEVVNFDPDKGFGFIASDTPGPDVFFHHKIVTGGNPKAIKKGQRVMFTAERGERGERANDVRLLSGWGGQNTASGNDTRRNRSNQDASRRGARPAHHGARKPEGAASAGRGYQGKSKASHAKSGSQHGTPTFKGKPKSQHSGPKANNGNRKPKRDSQGGTGFATGKPGVRKNRPKRVPRIGPNGPNRAARRAHLQRSSSSSS
jgi:superfamily II DNA/RNA helicase